MSKIQGERGVITFFSLLMLVLLVMPASAEMSFRIEDPLAEVFYDVTYPNGTIYMSDLNSSEICNLVSDGHYTVLLHSEPLRVASSPGSFYSALIDYGYAIIFLCVLVFLAGGVSGMFLTVAFRRRS